MERRQRRFVLYAGAFVGMILFYTLAYKVTLGAFENQTRAPLPEDG